MKKGPLFYSILCVCLIVPFANDVFLAAFPLIMKVFHTTQPQYLISVFLIGLAFTQPLYGPLFDRYGRKPILILGLVIYVLGGLCIVLAPNYEVLLVGRLIQALGACAGIVGTLAMARDVFPKEEVVKATSIIFGIISVAPAVAPVIGSGLTIAFGWSGSFYFLLFLGVFFLILVSLGFTETIAQKNMNATNIKHIAKNYGALIKNRKVLLYSLNSGFSYGVLFAFFGVAPLFILRDLGLHMLGFGIFVGVNALMIFCTAMTVPHFVKKVGLSRAVMIGTAVITLGGILMILVNSLVVASVMSLLFPLLVITIGVGIIRPSASGGVMSEAPKEIAGSAAAFFSFVSFVISAITTTICGALVVTFADFGIFVLICGLIGLGLSITNNLMRHQNGSSENTH